MKKEFLECGKIVSTHGVRGEVKIEPWCDDPALFEELEFLYLKKGAQKLALQRARGHQAMVLCKLEGVDDMDAANLLRGQVVYARREDIPLEEGEHFIQDLLGMDVVDADTGALYGQLVDVTETGANQVYHIRFADGKIRLAPAIPQVVVSIRVEENRMELRPLPGLFEGAEEIRDAH